MRRPALVAQLWLAVASTLFLAVAVAHAEPVAATPPAAEAPSAAAPEKAPGEADQGSTHPAAALIGGWQFLASAGFGPSTSKARLLEMSPYGASLGLDVGYTFRFGFRLGGYGGYSLGRSVDQTREGLVGDNTIPFTSNGSSVNAGISVGWDVPFYSFILRYSVGIGVTSMKWDFGSTEPRLVGWENVDNPVVGIHVLPGVALLWPHGLFEGGIGLDYLIQSSYTIPSGFIGKLIAGVRL